MAGTTTGTTLNNITDTSITVDPNSPVVSHPLDEIANQDVKKFMDTHAEVSTVVEHILQQSTSIPQTGGISYVGDINVNAFVRSQEIDFVAYNLRPNRRVYPHFDGKSISNIIEKPNIVEIDNSNKFFGLLPVPTTSLPLIGAGIDQDGNIIRQIDTSREYVKVYKNGVYTGSAHVYMTERATNGNTILYLGSFEPAMPNITNTVLGTGTTELSTNVYITTGTSDANGISVGVTIIGNKSLSVGNVVSYSHNSGKVVALGDRTGTSGNKTKITLSREASNTNNIYVGQSISVFSRSGMLNVQTSVITQYDGASQTATISPSFTNTIMNDDIYYTISDFRTSGFDTSNNSMYATSKGHLAGRIHIPKPGVSPRYRFRTGDKLFKITDSPDNYSQSATSIAEYNYATFGLDISKGQLTINYFVPADSANNVPTSFSNDLGTGTQGTPAPLSPPANVDDDIVATQEDLDAGTRPIVTRRYNPIAQSFFVSETEYPKGFFVPYIDLFFSRKGVLPVELQIRPLINGFPDSKNIVPGAVAVVDADDVKVSNIPNTSNSMTYTRFTFNSPAYLLPGADYVFTVGSNDPDYEIFGSEVGQKIIGTNRIVSEQPYLGNLFKSQNSSTYDAIQSDDLMFVIHKCQFVSSGSITFHEEKVPNLDDVFRVYYNANTKADIFEVQSDVVELGGTSVNYQYKMMTDLTDTLDAEFSTFRPDRRILLPTRKTIRGKNVPLESFFMQLDLTTTSRDISPIIFKERQNILTGATIINNMGLSTGGIQVANTGTGYTYGNTSVTITSNTGTSANGVILVKYQDFSEGRIETIFFDEPGYGYYDNVQITLTSSTGSDAVLNYISETDESGGPAVARYISKTVTLAPDFEAGDLRVFLTAVRPKESEILVYYKVRNPYDEEPLDAKKWVRMERKVGVLDYTSGFTPYEYEYAPSLSSNNIVYSSNTATFNSFTEFKIKIVLASSDTVFTKIPYVYDMRAVALPGAV